MARTQRTFAACLCVVILAGVAIVRADSSTTLRLTFDAARIVSPAVRANAIKEAARIWKRYDVSLLTEDDGQCVSTGAAAVTVTIDVGHDPAAGGTGLGAIQFASDGTPASDIVLNYDAVRRIATSAPFMGLHPALWPSGLREEIVARALGRALAHEIGHYLLRSPHHASSGLMQARHKGSMLGNPNDRGFELTKTDLDRLRVALASPMQPECPVLATR
ncbi:MAG TPA: hypothetical protein VF456_20050 [Vicinamibacterales bacterium]